MIYHAVWPPSIFMSLPVMKLEASLIKNTAAPRYSCGKLNFPSMLCVGQSLFRSGYCSNLKAVGERVSMYSIMVTTLQVPGYTYNFSTMAVTMYPGETVLTRIPYWPHSAARLRASCSTPALEVL